MTERVLAERPRDPLLWLAGAHALAALALWAFFATNALWGDDWELYAAALRGAGLLEPIAAHVRPLARLQFAVFARVPSPLIFHLLSLALHVAVSWCVWRYLRAPAGARGAMVAGLAFAGAFLANEAIYWISATGPLLCLLLVLLAALAWRAHRPVVATLLLAGAALSYELWLAGLVLLAFEGRRPWRHAVGPALVLAGFVGLQLLAGSGNALTAYGGFEAAALLPRLSIYAFRAISPLSGFPGVWTGLAVVVGLTALAAVPRYRAPVAFYFASGVVLALSSAIASRFAYFPQLALCWIAGCALDHGRGARLAASIFLVWFVVVGAVLNFRDGMDYRRLGALHAGIVAGFERALPDLHQGGTLALVDRTPEDTVLRLGAAVRGRPKLYFPRAGAIHGAINPGDLTTIVFARHGFRAEPAQAESQTEQVAFPGSAPPRISVFRASAW